MKETDVPIIFRQDNQLIEACYTLSLNEKRLLMLAMTKIDPDDFSGSLKNLKIILTAEEWSQIYNDDNAFRSMRRATDTMIKRYLVLHPKTGIIKKFQWLTGVTYNDGLASVSVKFSPEVSVRLAGMYEQFTDIDLLDVNVLKSVYSIRLYELLSQYRSTGYLKISMEDYRGAMDLRDQYKYMNELRRRVVAPSLKELNANTGFAAKVKECKVGRKVKSLEFRFKAKN